MTPYRRDALAGAAALLGLGWRGAAAAQASPSAEIARVPEAELPQLAEQAIEARLGRRRA